MLRASPSGVGPDVGVTLGVRVAAAVAVAASVAVAVAVAVGNAVRETAGGWVALGSGDRVAVAVNASDAVGATVAVAGATVGEKVRAGAQAAITNANNRIVAQMRAASAYRNGIMCVGNTGARIAESRPRVKRIRLILLHG
jgi:hypothetical protein